MKKRLLGFSILIYLMCLINTSSTAQQGSCTTVLSDAQDSFESGHLYGIPAILKPCLDSGFSKAEKIQAYWLLCRTYLIIDDPISAEDSYLKLLNLDPEYAVDEENDPIEIVHLSKKFKTTPIFTWTYFKAGLNTTSVSVINSYSTGNTNDSGTKYSGELGFQLSSSIELNINDNWSVNAEFMFAKRSFSSSNTLFDADRQSLKENQFWVELPFYVKYSRQFDRIHPYVYGGYGIQYLLSANATEIKLLNRDPSEGGVFAEQPVNGPNQPLIDSRTRFTQSAIAGAGVRYRIGYYYLMFEARYTVGLRNLLNEENQFPKSGVNNNEYNNELLFRYGYVDSDFKINNLSATFGIVKPLYKPRKINARPHFIQRLFDTKRKRGTEK